MKSQSLIIPSSYWIIPAKFTFNKGIHKYSIQEIIQIVSIKLSVSIDDLLSKSRKSEFTFARYVVWYIAVKHIGHRSVSLTSIFNKDHCSIGYGINKISGYLSINCNEKIIIEKLISLI